jgi:hypothetical protein
VSKSPSAGVANAGRDASIPWWMQADADPDRASRDHERMIELQRGRCSAPTGGQPDDECAILAPCEMFAPVLPAGIEQRRLLTRFGVNGVSVGLLVPVAGGAGQAQVAGFRRSVFGLGNNVVNLAGQAARPFGGLAIFAAALSTVTDQLAQGWGDFDGGH